MLLGLRVAKFMGLPVNLRHWPLVPKKIGDSLSNV